MILFLLSFLAIYSTLPKNAFDSKNPIFAFFYSSKSIFSQIAYNEFKSASKIFKKVDFLTIDCDSHPYVCRKWSIIGVPTFILLQNNSQFLYTGIRSQQGFIDFIESKTNILNNTIYKNPIINLYSSNFDTFINNSGFCNIVLCGINWCRYTIQIKNMLRNISNIYASDNVRFGYLNCVEFSRDDYCKTIPEISFNVNGTVVFEDMNSFLTVEKSISKINSICGKNRNVDGSLDKSMGVSQEDIKNIQDFCNFIKHHKKLEVIQWIDDAYPNKTYVKLIMEKIYENGPNILNNILNSTKLFFNYSTISKKVKDNLNVKLNILTIFSRYLE